MPRTLRRDLPQTVTANCQNRKQSILVNLNRDVPLGILALEWQLGLDAKFAVPQASVVRANISDRVQCKQPRFKYCIRHAEERRDFLLCLLIDATKKAQHCAE